MDILSVRGWDKEYVELRIKNVETRWSLKKENGEIRAIISDEENVKKLLVVNPDLDFDAALMSDCRSDVLNCGRCAFWCAHRQIT